MIKGSEPYPPALYVTAPLPVSSVVPEAPPHPPKP